MVFATRSDEHVHHTTDAVQSFLLRPLNLAPLSAYRETYSPRHNEVVVRNSAWPSAETEVSLSCILYNEACPWIRPYRTEVHVCLLMIQSGHVGLSTLVETGVRRNRL